MLANRKINKNWRKKLIKIIKTKRRKRRLTFQIRVQALMNRVHNPLNLQIRAFRIKRTKIKIIKTKIAKMIKIRKKNKKYFNFI